MKPPQQAPKQAEAPYRRLHTTAPHFCLRKSLFSSRFLLLMFLALFLPGNTLSAQVGGAASSGVPVPGAMANLFANLLKNSIPREYEKRKDWGNTKNITVGIRNDGLKIHRRKKPVKHGVWKRYRIRLIDPEETLDVRIENVQPSADGRLSFTLVLQAKADLWARAKVYQYGVHLIALESVGDAAIDLSIDCEVGMHLQTQTGSAGFALDPKVTNARLDIIDFHLRRVSNAKGPIIRELGEELPRIVEQELQGPKFVAKLNKAIDKKRDRLELSFGQLLSFSD